MDISVWPEIIELKIAMCQDAMMRNGINGYRDFLMSIGKDEYIPIDRLDIAEKDVIEKIKEAIILGFI
jgi:hypothetical protein